eukprot:3881560-Pleurochrysis_carterae.AAC.2
MAAVPRPLSQQLPLLLAVGALAHSSRGAVGVPEDDARTRTSPRSRSAGVSTKVRRANPTQNFPSASLSSRKKRHSCPAKQENNVRNV